MCVYGDIRATADFYIEVIPIHVPSKNTIPLIPRLYYPPVNVLSRYWVTYP